MAKIKIIIFNILFVVSSFGSTHKIDTVTSIYRSQIGVRELTGHNDGRQVEVFLASCNLSKGNPWCAAFITWVFKESGVKAVVSGYSPIWFPSKKTIYTRGASNNFTPGTADVFGIWFENKKRIAHVGFIDKWESGNYTITVEGNTNEAGAEKVMEFIEKED